MGHLQLKIFVEFLALLVVSPARVRSLLKKMKHRTTSPLTNRANQQTARTFIAQSRVLLGTNLTDETK
jgi:hypothetical protein